MMERWSGCKEEDEEEKEEIMRRGRQTERGEAKQGLWGEDMAENEAEAERWRATN